MPFDDPPQSAAWEYRDARRGFEVAWFHRAPDGGRRIRGCTTAIEDGWAWAVAYVIEVDAGWVTRTALITGSGAAGDREVVLEADGAGRWRVDGLPAPHLDGCLDVDLESSALTNTLPLHRLELAPGSRAAAPAAWVRAADLGVERLEQDYACLPDGGDRRSFDYTSPGFAARLVVDASGLVRDYPGIAVRAA